MVPPAFRITARSFSSWPLTVTGTAAAASAATSESAETTRPARSSWYAEAAAKHSGTHRTATCRCVHIVVAGHEAPHAVLPLVVGLSSTRRREPSIALEILIAHH